MLKNCRLFGTSDGDYAKAEVAWYKEQMDESDSLLLESKEKKKTEIENVLADMDTLKKVISRPPSVPRSPWTSTSSECCPLMMSSEIVLLEIRSVKCSTHDFM